MICYVLAMGKQHLGPHVVVGYCIKFFWPGLFITSPDHLVTIGTRALSLNTFLHIWEFRAVCNPTIQEGRGDQNT